MFHLFQFPFFLFGYTSTPCVPFLLSRNLRVGTSVSIVPVWLHKHAMRAFFVVEKPTRGYFSFHCSRLATQAHHACLFCCRETHAWVLQFPLFPFGYTSTPCVPFLLSRNTRVGTYHLHGKTGNSGLKIKWFPPLRLGSFRNYGL